MSAASMEKEGLLPTYIDSGHTAWLVVHSSYTKRRDVKKSLRMINSPSATQLGLSKNLCRFSRSVSSHFTTSSPRAVNVHAPATPPKRLFSPSLPTLHCVLVLKSSLWSLIVCTRRTVALNYSLSRHMVLWSRKPYILCVTNCGASVTVVP